MYKESFAAVVLLSPDGKTLYALDQRNWRVVAIDVATKKLISNIPTGSNPLAIALSPDGTRLYITNSGLFEYQLIKGFKASDPLHTAIHFPPFGYPSKAARKGTTVEEHDVPGLGDENNPRGSSLWTYDVSSPGAPRQIAELRLGSRIREGLGKVVGGASPSGVVAGQEHVYVSLAHDDSVDAVSTDGSKLEKEIPLTPFTGAAYKDQRERPLRGIMPFGLGLADQRLYVAEAGSNSVAVIDTTTNQVLTHIPVGQYPAAVAFSPDKRTLYVVNNKGKGTGPNIDAALDYDSRHSIKDLEFGSISRIPLPIPAQDYSRLTATVVRTNETTREVPLVRFPHEGLTPLNGQPAYDTSYLSHRQVAKDCLFSYRGNRYSVLHACAGKSVAVREPLDSGTIRVFHQQELIAEHRLSAAKGAMVIEPGHYAKLPRRSRTPKLASPSPAIELPSGPGVGLHYVAPEVEFRPLSIYNAFCEEVAHVASV